MKRTLWILALLAGACLVLALGLDACRTLLGAPSIANTMLYSLVGPVDTAGTQVNPATEDTLADIGTALGGGEDVKTAEVYAVPDATTTVLVSRVVGKKIVRLGLVLNVPTATTVTMIDGGTAGGTRKESWTFPATGGMVQPLSPLGWFEFTDGNTVSIYSDGNTTNILMRYVERTP